MREKQLVFIAGPILGRKNFNEEEFREAEKILRARGYDVSVPHDLFEFANDFTNIPDHQVAMKEIACLRKMAQVMLDADIVATLFDFEEQMQSKELVRIARICFMPIEPIGKLMDIPAVENPE